MFIETIRYENGMFHLLDMHQRRMLDTVTEVYGGGGCKMPLLSEVLAGPDVARLLPALNAGVCKCRVTYDTEIRKVELEPYSPRIVKSLRVVTPDSCPDYRFKYADRFALDALSGLRRGCDEIIIVRDGLVTDTSYSNLLFRAGDRLLTPRTPLLGGVMRRHLIESGVAVCCDITAEDILPGNRHGITEVYLINAMLPPGTVPPIRLSDVIC
ncbi:hypothetical protein ED352_10275 [Muribaculaceae bacterium Isolate-002 (NCI)]|nr:hypothetical protein ED352_10275 [Muribaculaceae bacterium Isolate-002 (NCI)]